MNWQAFLITESPKPTEQYKNVNYFPYFYLHLDNLFSLMFMPQFLEYA